MKPRFMSRSRRNLGGREGKMQNANCKMQNGRDSGFILRFAVRAYVLAPCWTVFSVVSVFYSDFWWVNPGLLLT